MRCRDAAARLVVIVALAAGGCRLARELAGGEELLRFDHRAHAARGLECTSCHAEGAERPRAGHPACAPCHAIGQTPDATCAGCHAAGRYLPAPPAPPGDLRVAHRLHGARAIPCERCHGDVARAVRLVLGAHRPTMVACLECHRGLGPDAAACPVCHERTTAATRPASHDGRWVAVHGEESRDLEARCGVCHAPADCVRCHQDTPPRDHTEFWLRRGHGLESRWDRERCLACHREDACLECHRTTPPANHGVGWGAPTFRHCQHCHLPLEDTACAVCHEQAHPDGVPFDERGSAAGPSR